MGKKCKEFENLRLEWADLVLPWLPPRSLASIASACKALRLLTKKITALRIADAARGLEKYPVLVLNSVDDNLYPYFLYTPTSIPAVSSPKQQWGHCLTQNPLEAGPLAVDADFFGSAGCTCIDCSQSPAAGLGNHGEENDLVRSIVIEEFGGEEGCPCNKFRVYTEDGRIPFTDGNCDTQFEGLNGGPPLVMECGPACRCGSSCRNRVSQRGLAVRVAVVRHPRKGWGLHSLEPITRGAFVCEYAGELLTTVEARERQRHYDDAIVNKHNSCSALLVIREHLPSGKACLRINIDATKIGNIARFINHSCDGGNLLPTLIRSSGSILARLCFFASRDICEGEELTFCYGIVRKNSKMSPCFCNTPVCCGMLPSEAT